MNETDPHPNPTRFCGRQVSFLHAGRNLAGTVTAQRYIGRTKRGSIPDYELTVLGASGKTLRVSLVETYAHFPE